MPNTVDPKRRSERVARRILEELTSALQKDLRDPRLQGVVFSHIEVSADLSQAKLQLVVLGDNPEYAKAEAARRVLKHLEQGLRHRLGTTLGLRRAPELRFAVDRGREATERLDAVLAEVSLELRNKPVEPAPEPLPEDAREK